jgi:hypothetical protein
MQLACILHAGERASERRAPLLLNYQQQHLAAVSSLFSFAFCLAGFSHLRRNFIILPGKCRVEAKLPLWIRG